MKTQTISKDTPLAEITLRKYELSNLKGRDLVRKLCLSLGLLQPGDSRDVVVDVLYTLLKTKKEMRLSYIEAEVIQDRKRSKLPLVGVASSNISRQLRRLRELMIVEKVTNSYRITEHDSLENIFNEKIQAFLLPSITNRVKELVKKVDEL